MPFADELLGAPAVHTLTQVLRRAESSLPFSHVEHAATQLDGLALGKRADLVRDALVADVDRSYNTLAHVVRTALASDPDFTGWMTWPVGTAVATLGQSEDTFDNSLELLALLTGRLTSEWALRIPLHHNLERTLETALAWTTSPDEHVRRLASEGTRPYLPWGVRVRGVTAQPGITLNILDALYRDESEYVRRSVANHLNDLSRENADLVVHTAQRWLADPDPNTLPLVKHALRTLVKRGHPDALALLGFRAAQVSISDLRVEPAEVPFGGDVRFGARVRNCGEEPERLVIDYVVHHRKANGSLSSKTFKLATCTLAPGEEYVITKSHSFRPITTRRYYPGTHAIAVQVNGTACQPLEFELLGSSEKLPVSNQNA